MNNPIGEVTKIGNYAIPAFAAFLTAALAVGNNTGALAFAVYTLVSAHIAYTLVRSSGGKRIPIPRVVERVRALREAGATLYCWSSGGADYARQCATDLGLHDCLVAFLPKPHVILDDQAPSAWKCRRVVHPLDADSPTVDDA